MNLDIRHREGLVEVRQGSKFDFRWIKTFTHACKSQEFCQDQRYNPTREDISSALPFITSAIV